jgi:hypothetical protein
MSTIFVQIAAYRDAECVPTIMDLFRKAAAPSNVAVGVCWQYLTGVDPETLAVAPYQDRVRMIRVDATTSRGVCWARHQAEQLYRGEDFVLQIDSHARFVPDWDVLMPAELLRCGAEKAVLSCNPPPYDPPDRLQSNPRPMPKRPGQFMGSGDIRCLAEYLDAFPELPVQCALVSGALIFGPGALLQEVPNDPWLYFNQEEMAYSLRLFTHGWNVYCPSQVLAYHHYYTAQSGRSAGVRPRHWQDFPDWGAYQKLGLARFNHLTGFSESTDPNVTVELDRYGLGQDRSLDDFQNFIGVDFRKKTVSDHGLQLRFIPGIERLRKNPVRIVPPTTDPKRVAK